MDIFQYNFIPSGFMRVKDCYQMADSKNDRIKPGKQLVYLPPRVKRITGIQSGTGADCAASGSGYAGECYVPGNTANEGCDLGNSAGCACSNGNSATPDCMGGSFAIGGVCWDGSDGAVE